MTHPAFRSPGNRTLFFSINLRLRRSGLLTRRIDLLRAAVGQTRRSLPFAVDAWVVLPDHMHCVWTLTAEQADFAARWSGICDRFAGALFAETGQSGDVWARDIWHHDVTCPADYDACLEYCWRDPVRHGLAACPEDWAWSSLHRRPVTDKRAA